MTQRSVFDYLMDKTDATAKCLNVLLGEDATPKITDFGLAKKMDVETGQPK